MQFYNLNDPSEKVSFSQAVRQGLGRQQGLFFPETLPRMDARALATLPRQARYLALLRPFVGEDLSDDALTDIINSAFDFPAPIVTAGKQQALELFHGPTLAFKDFGARFMAQCLARFRRGPVTILTATSGDTGAAVAHAFFKLPGIRVLVLYPADKISRPQEQLFCTLGGNIETYKVAGSFDDCQALVKTAFDDPEIVQACQLTSANSINISRLLAQMLYFWDLALAVPDAVVSVPCGNFGNLTAGLIAQRMGAPIRRFIAATNSNDTVPRYLNSGQWQPHATVSTLSNAMDVSRPNNWPRVEALLAKGAGPVAAVAVSELQTEEALLQLAAAGYQCEPHGAVAYHALQVSLQTGEQGVFLCTAHPAKFKDSVDAILGTDLPLPPALAKTLPAANLSVPLAAQWPPLRQILQA